MAGNVSFLFMTPPLLNSMSIRTPVPGGRQKTSSAEKVNVRKFG
jgi:hypothetical protein